MVRICVKYGMTINSSMAAQRTRTNRHTPLKRGISLSMQDIEIRVNTPYILVVYRLSTFPQRIYSSRGYGQRNDKSVTFRLVS